MSRGPDPTITTLDVLRVFLSHDDPAFIAPEVAEELDVSLEGVRNRLNRAVEDGYLAKKRSGSRTVLYWITQDGIEYYAEQTSDCS